MHYFRIFTPDQMDKKALISKISPPLDKTLAELLLKEYNSLESRYILRDWEPATLDAGQFAEVCSRILYHIDSANLSLTKEVKDCLNYIEDPNNKNIHHYPDRKSSIHTAKVIRTIYKFRSDRGAVHINPNYTANQLDATLVMSCTRWLLSELLRLFLTSDLNLVEKAIRDILEFNIPVIGDFEGLLLVQRTDCTTDEEILILLHYAGQSGFNRTQIGRSIQKSAPAITTSLQKLASSQHRMVIKLATENYRLTDIGNKFVIEKLADKLSLR
jgi:hypothetical protein